MNGICPECGATIETPDDVMVGEIFSCASCGEEVEVTKIADESVKVDLLGIEGEDWGE